MTGSSFQVIAIATFIRKFIDDNPLCVCSDEISQIKRTKLGENDEIKLKQKTSQVIVLRRYTLIPVYLESVCFNFSHWSNLVIINTNVMLLSQIYSYFLVISNY